MHHGDPIASLEEAVAQYRSAAIDSCSAEEVRRLRAVVDSLEGVFCGKATTFERAGGHLAEDAVSAVAWVRNSCNMSGTSAADRLCVGKQLESLPHVAEALSSGKIGYQAAAVLCHLREQLEDKRDLFVEVEMLDMARLHTVAELRLLCRHARRSADPDGFYRDEEENFTRRRLHISPMADGMHIIDGVLDAVGGAAVRTALEALATSGSKDERKHSQRMADALVELTHHALDSGRLPKKRGVKPHVSLTTTLEALKGELGAPAVDVEFSLPVSSKTLERFACDCTMSRVLLADSQVIDVGRATRIVSGPQGGRSRPATSAADSPAATGRSAGPARITSNSGPEADQRMCPTWSRSATSIIAWFMKGPGRWSRSITSSVSSRRTGRCSGGRADREFAGRLDHGLRSTR